MKTKYKMKTYFLMACLTIVTALSLKAQNTGDGELHNSIEGPDKSKDFPKSHIHNSRGGADYSRIFPNDYIHNNITGTETSKMFPKDYVHNTIDGSEKSKMFPKDYVHNTIDGSEKSKMFPSGYVHNPAQGWSQSKMFPSQLIHNSISGPDHSGMFTSDYVHNPIAGEDQSRMFPHNYVHMARGFDASTMVEIKMGTINLSVSIDSKNNSSEAIANEEDDRSDDKSKKENASKTFSIHNSKLKLDVYPNPVANEVSVSPVILPDFVSNATFTLMNIEGKIVKTQIISNADITGTTLNLNITELPTGVYIGSLNVNGATIIQTGKIIKQ